MDNYVFFPNLDYIGCDICCLNGKSIENIKEYCNLNNECVAFNTFGYVKYYVDKNKFTDNTLFGSYIKNDYCSHIDNMIMNYNNNNTNNTNNNTNNTNNNTDMNPIINKVFLTSNNNNTNINLPIYCINLERRPDRKNNVLNEFNDYKDLKIDFIKAIDGSKIVATESIKELFKNNDFGSRKNVIGCALSHYNLWKKLLNDENNDKYLILEDDIELCDDFGNKLNMILNNIDDQIDIFYIGYHMFNRNRPIYNSKIVKNEMYIDKFDTSIYIGGLFGYIITKSGVKKLLDFINKHGIQHGIDYLMLKYIKDMDLNIKECIPHIINSTWVENFNSNVD